MKHLFTILFIAASANSFCQVGEWTWMNGTTTPNSLGSFGTQGVSSPSNYPPALYEAAHWTDTQGNLWLFGGVTLAGSGEWADLWKYDPLINEWTWVKGPGVQVQPGVYGTQGISDPSNNPGSRSWGLISWTDANHDFWLYGGIGSDNSGSWGNLGDLWKYTVSTNEWTWMSGTNSVSTANSVYGTYQEFSATVYPGAINETTAGWIDTSGNLWFFGGNSNTGTMNTMWEYDVSTNEWAWMSGSSSPYPTISYGTQGVFSDSNHPDGRVAYCTWVDSYNKFWMFGGSGNFNKADLWEFDPELKQWAWMSGSNVDNYTGNAGAQCDTSLSYVPMSRRENTMSWADSCGNIWMYGGYYDPVGGFLSDMWALSTETLAWAWTDGSLFSNLSPVYGTQGVSSPTNDPGGRMGCPYWKDVDGNFWLLGGWGLNSWIYSDLWRYKPDHSCPNFGICTVTSVTDFEVSSQELCQKFCIDFTDQTSGNPTSWQWSFPGASPSSSTEQNPDNICYNLPGTYDVTLITTGANGSSELTLSNYITVYATPPFPVITQNGYTLTSSPADSYQWELNATDIPGATNQSYEVLQTGFYTVVVTDSNGCKNSSVLYVQITGIDEINDGNISVYPNPSDGNFLINFSAENFYGNCSIKVFNAIGQEIYKSEEQISEQHSKKKIQVINQPSGIYLIEVIAGNNLLNGKLIIEK